MCLNFYECVNVFSAPFFIFLFVLCVFARKQIMPILEELRKTKHMYMVIAVLIALFAVFRQKSKILFCDPHPSRQLQLLFESRSSSVLVFCSASANRKF